MCKPGLDAVSNDEGEQNVAKRLLSSVAKHHKFKAGKKEGK